jgi:crotonobetainyl-CoA:carnitine CoA-transferase CaiB-like acyl-CoA transferase
MVAALAIVASLRRQDRTGLGEVVDVSLLDSDLALMAPRIASYLAGEPEPSPSGGTDSVLAVYQVFETAADGALVLAIGNDVIWKRFCPLVGLPELADDPRLASNAGRRGHRDEVLALIAERLAGDTAEAWLDRFGAAGIPAAPVQTLSEVVADQQVEARKAIVEMRRDGETVYGVRSPWRLSSQPVTAARAAPGLGADTVAVLREHGLSEEQVGQLLADGAVHAAADCSSRLEVP